MCSRNRRKKNTSRKQDTERNWNDISKYRDELFGIGICDVFAVHSTYFYWTTGRGTVWFIPFIIIMYFLYPLIFNCAGREY